MTHIDELHRVALLAAIDKLGIRYDDLITSSATTEEDVKIRIVAAIDRYAYGIVIDAEVARERES